MTKEEYMQKLMSQVGEDETLIPETNPETQEAQVEGESETGSENDGSTSAAAENVSEVSGEDSNSTTEEVDGGETEKSEIGGSESEEEPVNPDNGKKYSNKKIKKTIWENKHLAKEVADLKRQLEELRASNNTKPEKKELVAPSRSQFSSDEDYTNAAFAYNLQLLSEKNRKITEEQMAIARANDEKQRVYDEKVNSCIPESKKAEFEAVMTENWEDLKESISEDAADDIVSMSTTPLILWKLAQAPDLISAVNRMNQVERIMFLSKVADQAKSELSEPARKQAKAPVVGKVGTGKAANRNMEEMTAEEMYNYTAKRLAGG